MYIYITKGSRAYIGEYSLLEQGENPVRPSYVITAGSLSVSDHVRLQCQKIWVRFGGRITIGRYTNINRGTEIRSDEFVSIGCFCRISYNIRIWDTNTHCIYTSEKRRKITQEHFPSFGYEYEKPQTQSVIIADDVWLGEKVSILKGTELGQGVIVGYNTTIINKKIPDNKRVVSKNDLLII